MTSCSVVIVRNLEFFSIERSIDACLKISIIKYMLSFADMLMGKDLMTRDVDDGPGEPVTFLSLKYKLVDLMIMAVQCETDSYNTQMLLGKYNMSRNL